MPEAVFLGSKILVFTAHPDDESYLAAGTIYENTRRGGKTFLVCATGGELGSAHLKKPISPRALKLLRKREFFSAAEYLGAQTPKMLNFPDGRLHGKGTGLYRQCLATAENIAPDCILSFGQDGITGHMDHIEIGRAAKKIAKRLRVPFYAFALPPRFAKDALERLKYRRKKGTYTKGGVEYEKPNVFGKISRQIKLRALRFHASQMEGNKLFTGYPDYAVKALLNREYFVKMKT